MDLHGIFPWCGVPAFLIAGQHTLKQARNDLAVSFWYLHERAQEWIALAEFRKQAKKKGAKRVEAFLNREVGVQKIIQEPHWHLPVMAAHTASPDDYHSGREPSEFKYESNEPKLEAPDAVPYLSEIDK